MLAARAANGIEGLPSDEHGHDGGFSGSGGELESEAADLRIRVPVCAFEVLQQTLAGLRERSHLGEPDRRFDRLDLAEEGAHAGEYVMPPVLEKASSLGGHAPLIRGQGSPCVHIAAHLVDDRGLVILLFLRGKTLSLVEDHFLLRGIALPFFRFRNRRDEFRFPTRLDDLLGRLALLVEFPVPIRILVGGVEDRAVKERVVHVRIRLCVAVWQNSVETNAPKPTG